MKSLDRLEQLHNTLISLCEKDHFTCAVSKEKIRLLLAHVCKELQVSRVSTWDINQAKTLLVCHDLYLAEKDQYEAGMELSISDYPSYFHALEKQRVIVADNARTHPATSEFTENYLIPLNIYSMLDTPIYASDNKHGVLCVESCQEARHWAIAEVSFIIAVADKISLILEHDAWRKAKDSISLVKRIDALTKLESRVFFQERVEDCSRCINNRKKRNNAILAIGIDSFTDINDAWGHTLANKVLEILANRLSVFTQGKNFFTARIGGDIFGILVPEITNNTYLDGLVEEVLSIFNAKVKVSKHVSIDVSSCMGVVVIEPGNKNSTDPIRYAEIALQRAKKSRPGSVQIFDNNWLHDLHQKRKTENDLLLAIDQNQLIPYYQPIIDCQSKRVVGVEALVRWDHPLKGVLTPFFFLPLATEMGLMPALGERMLTSVFADIERFQLASQLKWFSINLAAEQLYSPNIVEQVSALLLQHNIPGSMLELEIVEDLINLDTNMVSERLSALAELGVKLSIDDFGTGYSSLARLKHLPVAKLKIDKSFIDDLPSCESDQCIVASIMGLAKGLGLSVVAEGVEQHEQADWLIGSGCQYIQGYLFARPMPIDELVLFLERKDLYC